MEKKGIDCVGKGKLLVVVDMQNDFISGSLGSPSAEAIVDRVCEKIKNWDGDVVYTEDTHYDDYPNTNEGKHISVAHCVRSGSKPWGWELHDQVKAVRAPGSIAITKESFGSFELAQMAMGVGYDIIEIVGLCTDICVVSNALMIASACKYSSVRVDASCCAGTSNENHNAALKIMQQCCIDIINWE